MQFVRYFILRHGHPDDQILVQSMVPDVALSGVAFTRTLEHGAPWYVVNYESGGNTESITVGQFGSPNNVLKAKLWC